MNGCGRKAEGVNRGVSIHIRHCWRMNGKSTEQLLREMGFNPHSPLLANELRQAGTQRTPGQFQSTFAIAGE